MSFDAKIDALIAALEANTAALKAAGSAAPAGDKPAADKPAAAAEKPAKAEKAPKAEKPAAGAHTHAEMAAALNEVKEHENLGIKVAKALIKEVGGADKMGDINDPAKIDAVYAAAKAKLAEVEEEGM